MKSKLFYLGVVIACVSLFSFKEVCNDTGDPCVKPEIQGKNSLTCPEQRDGEWTFSPLYNFLKI
jgi:hypothetical protein